MAASVTSSLTEQLLLVVVHPSLQHHVDCLRQLMSYDVISYKLSGAASMALYVSLVALLDCRIASHGCYCRLVESTLEVTVALLACAAPPTYSARLSDSWHKAAV